MAETPARGRVLVLDDEANMGKVLTKLLRLEGFDVQAFVKPREAMDSLEKRGAEVLLTDLRMPEMSGDELAKQIKKCMYMMSISTA